MGVKQSWHDALIDHVNDFADRNYLSIFQIIEFCSSSLVDMLIVQNCKDELAKKIFDNLYEEFQLKKIELRSRKKENGD